MKEVIEWFEKNPMVREIFAGVLAHRASAWFDSTKTQPEIAADAEHRAGEMTLWKRLGIWLGKNTTVNRPLLAELFLQLRLSIGEDSWLERLCTWANNVAHGPFQLWQAFPELIGSPVGQLWTSEDRLGRFLVRQYEEYERRNNDGMGRMLQLEAKLRQDRELFFSDMLGLSKDDGVFQEALLLWRRATTTANGYAPQMQQVATWLNGLAPAPTPPPAPGFLNWLINLF